uniref:Catenin delta-2 n=1 Tax=Cacopsylla melanoneura TaxID=428564 RepID=A0A8D8S5A1_9HEMI
MKIDMSNNQPGDSCLQVNRRVESLQEHSITRTEITQRRILQPKSQEMPKFQDQQEINPISSYSVDVSYIPTNGHPNSHSHSPNLSIQSSENSATATLLSRTQKQLSTQQVTTVTKVIREVHHMGPDGQSLGDYGSVGMPYPPGPTSSLGHSQFSNYSDQEPPGHHYMDQYRPSYSDYEPYPGAGQVTDYAQGYPGGPYQTEFSDRPPTPPSPSERSESPPPQQLHEYLRKGAPYPPSGYDELDAAHMLSRPEHYRITPSPGGIDIGDRYDCYPEDCTRSNSFMGDEKYVYSYGGSVVPEESGRRSTYQEESQSSVDSDQRGLRWRDPNLTEVISFLSNPNNVIKANAAAYLQHLCYMDDPNKQKTRSLGGIPPLVKLLGHESPDVFRNACGALRNLSYGRQNDENKRAIKNAGGIPLLINLLRKTADAEVKELVTGVLWNLSSCEDLKKSIIDDGLQVVVNHIIIPHSGWDPVSAGETCWSTIFRNTSGVLRNASSAGEYARKKLRECEGLIDSLLYVVKSAIEKSNIGNKSVENCVCILRNLSFRCQEVDDPNYDKHPVVSQSRTSPQGKGENLGCFGASKKKKESQQVQQQVASTSRRNEPVKGMELLWQPEVVQSYLSLLQRCSNPETLEAAAGALQNLAACYWQPSIEIRAAVRKEKGLPILVELLRMEVDRVVCAAATALRNLAIDQRNKELIGKYAMRDLVQKLPSGNAQHDQGTSDDTIAAVLATLNEVIKKNAEFSRSLLESGGVERLMNITKQRQKYTPRVLKFAGQVLFTMWQHQELREVYKKHGWKEQDFVTKTVAARNAGPNSPNNANSTLNRPMASQGGTRYEDRTIQRPNQQQNMEASRSLLQNDVDGAIPMADMTYPDSVGQVPPTGGVRIFPPGAVPIKPGEPLYAQVNREKKKNRGTSETRTHGENWSYEDGEPGPGATGAPGGDSWV